MTMTSYPLLATTAFVGGEASATLFLLVVVLLLGAIKAFGPRWFAWAVKRCREVASRIPMAPAREGDRVWVCVITALASWSIAGLGRADIRLRAYVHARGRTHRGNSIMTCGLFIATTFLASAGLKPFAVITAVPLFLLVWVWGSTPNRTRPTPMTSKLIPVFAAKSIPVLAAWFALTGLCLLPAAMLFGGAAVPATWLFMVLAARRGQQLRYAARSSQVANPHPLGTAK